jgi:hypothetical protein
LSRRSAWRRARLRSPTRCRKRNTRHDAHIAKAQAGYALALKRCDYMAAAAKDAFLEDAEASHVAARADPEAQAKAAAINAGKR